MKKNREALTTIFWFRNDLRLSDNPGLLAACKRGGPVVPVFIWAPEEEGLWPPGTASRWWLKRSLQSLDSELRSKGSHLFVCRGPSLDTLSKIANATGATSVFWNRRPEPAIVLRDLEVKTGLARQNIATKSFEGNLLFEPGALLNQAGRPFKVFTAFWNSSLKRAEPETPLAAPVKLPTMERTFSNLTIESLCLDLEKSNDAKLESIWKPGTSDAASRLETLLEQNLGDYEHRRDLPAVEGTSLLSPHLHFGEISAKQVWHAVRERAHDSHADNRSRLNHASEVFRRQLMWREFALHQLHHFPHIPESPSRAAFKGFPWHRDGKSLAAWKEGFTGYPLVDAGMRELNETGWMHNRVRMIVASFLVKHLLISWQTGAHWFWEKLLDADLANNTMGWQWSAGCGFDASPYFRIFNPVVQGKKFDPEGEYVRRWVPELADIDKRWIHEPWKSPDFRVTKPKTSEGRKYPRPIVDHAEARERALAALASIQR